MHRSAKIVRAAVVTAVSLFVSMFAQADIMNSGEPLEKSVKTNVYEVTQKKTAKSSIEKPTEKSTEKSKKKPTEKSTEEATEPTEAPTEEITEAPTEAPTEFATMQVITIVSNTTTSEAYDYTLMNPTEPVTEWTQELQDLYDEQYNAGYLVAIDNPDYSYYPRLQINLSEEDKKLACQIVQGEAGGEGYESCCVVAQCLKDSMISLGYKSIKEVQVNCKYDGWKEEYSEDALRAVEYIFDQNRSAIAHRVLFFYATNLCTSKWHETQNHILTINKTRYFDMW